ncbi:MAG: aromatic ring-hydroxylating dioxygenase subunit alpha [Leptolyngbyaceae bacterium]|nr:aromatic ring-hydroxylating dioxygenase subunit alpha [Leptolyngbyaceae bacterium]
MNLMNSECRHAQQPSIFNNWNVIAQGWYIACASREVPQETAKSIELCGQRIVLFRGADKRVRALDAYCPHMGTDLGIGRVDGTTLRCFFHHWAFDGQGQCADIPCQTHIPTCAHTQSYATEEKYGFIWVYPEAIAPEPVAEFDELKGMDMVALADRPLERHCHHHICMMNGIDAQHLQTVHKLNIQMQLELQENTSGTVIDFTLSGEFPHTTFREKLMRRVLGDRYAYTMRYAHGCLGLLTLMKDVKRIPRLHMLYAYVPVNDVKTGIQKTRIQPIYVTRKRPGVLGTVISQCLLHLTRLCYYILRDEDGLIYDNIQFAPRSLLKIDAPIVQYMAYVNRLSPSRWSNQTPLP